MPARSSPERQQFSHSQVQAQVVSRGAVKRQQIPASGVVAIIVKAPHPDAHVTAQPVGVGFIGVNP